MCGWLWINSWHNLQGRINGLCPTLCEAAFGAQDLRAAKYTFSACKSVVSLSVGLLVDLHMAGGDALGLRRFPGEWLPGRPQGEGQLLPGGGEEGLGWGADAGS